VGIFSFRAGAAADRNSSFPADGNLARVYDAEKIRNARCRK
jgi:hypothetical protein